MAEVMDYGKEIKAFVEEFGSWGVIGQPPVDAEILADFCSNQEPTVVNLGEPDYLAEMIQEIVEEE